MLTDAAHIIFETARRRCFTVSSIPGGGNQAPPPVVDLVDDQDAWDALNEVEGIQVIKDTGRTPGRPDWLPPSIDPVLEELPKWDLLTEILQEIEEEIIRFESMKRPGMNARKACV